MNNKLLLSLLKLKGPIECTCGQRVGIKKIIKSNNNFALIQLDSSHEDSYIIFDIVLFETKIFLDRDDLELSIKKFDDYKP